MCYTPKTVAHQSVTESQKTLCIKEGAYTGKRRVVNSSLAHLGGLDRRTAEKPEQPSSEKQKVIDHAEVRLIFLKRQTMLRRDGERKKRVHITPWWLTHHKAGVCLCVCVVHF